MHPSSSGDTQAKASTDTNEPDSGSGSAEVVTPTVQTLPPISASDSQTSGSSNPQSDGSEDDGGNAPPQDSAQNHGPGTIKSVAKKITGIKLH